MRAKGNGGVRKRGKVWYVRPCINGQRAERRTDAQTRKEAIAILNDLQSRASKGTLTIGSLSVTVAELFEAMKEDYRVRGQRVGDLDKRWLHLKVFFGRDRAIEVTTPRIREYIVSRQEQKAAPATIQRELSALRRMMRLGRDDGHVMTVPSFPSIRVENVRTGFIDHGTLRGLCAVLPEPVSTMAVVSFFIGWRLGELRALQWRHIELKEGTIRLDAGMTKNREGRRAYLPEEALTALKEWRDQTSAFEKRTNQIVTHVFHRNGKPVKSIAGAWKGACASIGQPNLLFHDLRRCAVRSLSRAGVPETVAMRITGHKTRSVFDRYNITADADLKNAADLVGRLQNGANQGQVAFIASDSQVAKPRK